MKISKSTSCAIFFRLLAWAPTLVSSQTNTFVVTSPNTNRAIRDRSFTYARVSISECPRVLDANVRLVLSHTYIGDLEVALISPRGTQVGLFRDACGSSDFSRTALNFDDASSRNPQSCNIRFGGTFYSSGRNGVYGTSLNTLNGQDGSGTWTLRIYDDAYSDQGTLHSFRLTLKCESPRPPTLPPTNKPSAFPSAMPSKQPSVTPSTMPSHSPSQSLNPSAIPSMQPSSMPSMQPTLPNDYCGRVQEIVSIPSTTTGSTIGANADPEANPYCGGTSITEGGVWYEVTGTGNGIIVDIAENTYDTKLHVFSGNCGSFTCIAGNDDSGSASSTTSGASYIKFDSTYGVSYKIFVHGIPNSIFTNEYPLLDEEGMFTLELRHDVSNEYCNNAETLAYGDSVTGSIVGAASDSFDTTALLAALPSRNCPVEVNGNGIWYEITGTGFEVSLDILSADFDTSMHVFYGNTCGSLVCVAFDDDNGLYGGGTLSSLTFYSKPATT